MIKKILKFILFLFPVRKNWILLESCPDFSDNTYAVFKELINQKVNQHKKIIWICFDNNKISQPKYKNVFYLRHDSIKACLAIFYSKYMIICNRFLGKKKRGRIVFYLSHGNPLKNVKYYLTNKNIDYIDYFLTTSYFMANLFNKFYGVDKNKLVVLGFPRNDDLFENKINLHIIFNIPSEYKIIAWYPTVRQFNCGGKETASNNPLPLIWDKFSFELLNNCLIKNKVVIILKPHFAQNVTHIKESNSSNFIIISDTFFKQKNINSYQFLSATDALLTDYSSIYFDYMIVNKPIGLIWEDLSQFMEKTGFVNGIDPILNGGEKIYDINDLISFVCRIANDIDLLKKERNICLKQCDYFLDDNSSKRVVDFIKKIINIKEK